MAGEDSTVGRAWDGGRSGEGDTWEKGCGGLLREADLRQRDWVDGGLPVLLLHWLVASFFLPDFSLWRSLSPQASKLCPSLGSWAG